MWSLALLLLAPAEAKPPKLLKALTASFDPATPARTTLEAYRAQLSIGPVDGPIVFATAAAQVLPMLPEAERQAVVTEALGYLDGAARADPAREPEVEAVRGTLLLASGDRAGAEAALRRSYQASPSLAALSPLLELVPAEAPALCAAARPVVTDVFGLLDVCVAHGDELAWASPADLQSWRKEQERRAVAAAQREAEMAARLEASFSSPAPQPSYTASAAPSPAPAGPTSVTLKNNCRNTVRVFFGDKPRYSSGTTSHISGNSLSSYSLRPGSLIWIVDDRDNPLSSTSVGTSAQRIEISSTCTGFGAQ